MRSVKFRGKRTDNGEWVYGNLIKMKDSESYGDRSVFSNAWIVETEGELNIRGFVDECAVWSNNCFIQVVAESVGQYTGLKDKENREIYEGDVLTQEQHISYYVKFVDGGFYAVSVDTVQRVNWEPVLLSNMHLDSRSVAGNIYEDKLK